MIRGPHHDPGWVAWPGDASVEYQIDQDFLRVRRWRDGQPIISEWERCGATAETTIRHQLSLLRQKDILDGLPALPEKSKINDSSDHALLEWILKALLHPLNPTH